MGQTTRWPSVWRSKYFFFIISYRLRALKTLHFHICNFIKKINWKGFCKELCKILWKKIILGTSDAWSTSRLSHRPSELAYYIVNRRILNSVSNDGFFEIIQLYELVSKWMTWHDLSYSPQQNKKSGHKPKSTTVWKHKRLKINKFFI